MDANGTRRTTWSSATHTVDAPVSPHAQRGRPIELHGLLYPDDARHPERHHELRFVAGMGRQPPVCQKKLRLALVLLVGHWFCQPGSGRE